MEQGGKFLVSAAVLAVAACGNETGKLEIRSTPTALAQGEHPVSFRVAEASGQLALGNVALALEGFRKAWREDPNSIEALAGMANCYDRMGRFDLSRRNYEAALAIAPSNLTLLAALASSLDQQGDRDGAGKVRQEIALRTAAARVQAAAATQPIPEATDSAAVEVAQVVAPAPIVKITPIAAPAPVVVAAPVSVTDAIAVLKSVPVAAPVAAAAPVLAAAVARVAVAPVQAELPKPVAPPSQPIISEKPVVAVAASTVTVKLPPARSAGLVTVSAVTFPAKAATIKPASLPPSGPHLERLSMGEVALISAPTPMWRPTTVARNMRSTTVRFVPLREASTVPVQVRLLNAARVNRLAARTRSWLVARGWYGLGVGDANTVRTRSVILYPVGQRRLAQRLSSQFGFAMQQRASGSQITVLLGRDASRHPALRQVRG